MFKKRTNTQSNTQRTTQLHDNDTNNNDSNIDINNVLNNKQNSTNNDINNKQDILTELLSTTVTQSTGAITQHNNIKQSATIDTSQDKLDRDKINKNKKLIKPIVGSNVRQITVTDYKPDICKDYNETGFCSFGDSCKFLHDRTDYKNSYQIDNEYNNKRKLNDSNLSYDDIARKKLHTLKSFKDDRLKFMQSNKNNTMDVQQQQRNTTTTTPPDKCYICKQSLTDPIKTICNHYFCLSCAIKYNQQSKLCAICKKPTNGIFNTVVINTKQHNTGNDNCSDNDDTTQQSDTND